MQQAGLLKGKGRLGLGLGHMGQMHFPLEWGRVSSVCVHVGLPVQDGAFRAARRASELRSGAMALLLREKFDLP